MQNPELAAPDWEPRFADYLYLSFTNTTAFSLVVVALVVARAVNVLG